MPATEYAAYGAHSVQGYRSLARHAGLTTEQVATLALQGELRSLFGTDGRLLPRPEIRSRFAAVTDGSPSAKAAAAIARTGPGISGRQALNEIMRKRPFRDPRAELLVLQAKRQAWRFP